MTDSPRLSAPKALLFVAILLVVAPLFLLTVLEGGASALMFARDYVAARSAHPSLRKQIVSDSVLGWANRGGFASGDEFGPGRTFSTNTQGFRGAREFDVRDTSVQRVLCYGDSFTLGVGVADDQTWCARLEQRLPGIQTVNAGEDAYGLDQSFLKYKHDHLAVRHRVVVLAMTEPAFERSTSDRFQGRFKPTLAISNDSLVLHDAPVPEQTPSALEDFAVSRTWSQLRVVQLARAISGFDPAEDAREEVDAEWPLFERIMAEFDSLSHEAGSSGLLLYLPARRDLSTSSEDRRERIANYAATHHIRYLDLTSQLQAMRKDSADLAFITQPAAGSAPGVTGFYSPLGHDWVAQALALEFDKDSLAGVPLGFLSQTRKDIP